MPRTNICKSPELVAIENKIREWIRTGAKSTKCAEYLSTREVGAFLGLRDTAAAKWLKDTEYVLINNRRRYRVETIAEKIYQSINL